MKNKDNIKITVGTVCYNAVNCIENLIKSVNSQNYSNIEFVVVDGASKDGTSEVLQQYKECIDVVVCEPDKGIYDAMNKLLKKATGDFLIFMGADDVFYDNNVLGTVASHMDDMDSVYYGSVIFKGLGAKHWGRFNKVKWATGNVCHQALFYPRSVYTSYKYNTDYAIFADYAYNLNLLKNKIAFKYVDVITTLYDMTGVSASRRDNLFMDDYKRLVSESVGISYYYIGCIVRSLMFVKAHLAFWRYV